MIQAQKTTGAARRMPPNIQIVRSTEQEAELAVLYAITGHPGISAADRLQRRSKAEPLLNPLALDGIRAADRLQGRSKAKPLLNLLTLDPAEMAQKRFLSSIERALPPVNFTYYPNAFDAENMKVVRDTFGEGIISLYETRAWKIYKSATLSDVYRISYTGRATFYRQSDNAILWEGECVCDSPDDQQGPSLDAMIGNNGALLRQYLVKLGEACADMLSRDFLGSQ